MNDQQETDYCLPRNTAKLLTGVQIKKCRNLGLILDKYPPQMAIQTSEGKSRWLKEIASGSYIDTRLTEHVYKRWVDMTRALEALHFSGTTDWRMAIGLGGETVLETDLTLHHLYGFPYIPGSALKGLTRAYVTGEVYPSPNIEEDNEAVKHIFGSQERAGSVIFFDAIPVNGGATFILDIMNSHYPNYYGEKKPPTNDQNPNPVTFLTVTNTKFMFALALRRGNNQNINIEQVKKWLQEALEKYGVGGKTSAGYGYFKEIHDEQEPASGISLSQTTSTLPSIASSGQKLTPPERIRPNIPKFREGQDITGAVVTPTDVVRQRAPSDATAFLRYQSYALTDVLIVVNAEEAQGWKPGETRICLFMREEIRDGCTLLICQPRPHKKKKE